MARDHATLLITFLSHDESHILTEFPRQQEQQTTTIVEARPVSVSAGGNVVTVGGGPITVQLPAAAVQTVTTHRLQPVHAVNAVNADRMETAAAVASVVPVVDTRTIRIGGQGGQRTTAIQFHRFE